MGKPFHDFKTSTYFRNVRQMISRIIGLRCLYLLIAKLLFVCFRNVRQMIGRIIGLSCLYLVIAKLLFLSSCHEKTTVTLY